MSESKFICLFLSVLIGFSCTAQELKSDLEKNNVKGKVRLIREASNPTDDSAEYNPKMASHVFWDSYNKKGNLILHVLSPDEKRLDTFTVKYDQQGRKTEYISDHYESNGNESCYWESYDQRGRKIVAEDFHKIDDEWSAVITEYNNMGDNTEIYMVSSKNKYDKISTTSNLHDDNGRLIEEVTFDYASKKKSRVTYQYDNAGNQIQRNYWKSDSSLNYKIEIKFDDKGNPIVQTYYNADMSIYSIENYTYDEYNNPTQIISDKKFKPIFPDHTIYYEYDKYGNWTKRIDDIKIRKDIATRTIEYY